VADLQEYRDRRSFDRTPEPKGDVRRTSDQRRFVVQEHHARRLHWDLRLEHDGALLSWALPRGIPDDPDKNRLAVRTEDHPLEYLSFEGEIPAGEYGAGTMSIWDHGSYEAEELEENKLVIRLDGERVQGRFALFRTKQDWLMHRMDPPENPGDPFPDDLSPMKATLASMPSDEDAWGFEIKWDGVRALAYAEPGRLRLVSRGKRDISGQYPEISRLSRRLGSRRAVLDGELVAFDDDGKPSFQRLQPRMHGTSESEIQRRRREIPVTYVIFDLLYLDGRSLLGEPYDRRRRALEDLELDGPHWQVPEYHEGGGTSLLDATREQGIEGVIAKRLDSPYRPGRRSRDWLKIKNVLRQEVVIGGWLPGKGRREGHLGALLVGYYEDDSLRYAGKVGTGFDKDDLDLLRDRLAPLERKTSPFTGPQPKRDSVFVEPKLVCEVTFTEWTRANTLRHPSYQGLRDDKPATDVVREEPA
jgi:bifunctional non-homologous end joining protein LigD